MKVKVVGLGPVFNYKDKKTGADAKARNLYIVRAPSPRENGTTGMIAQRIFIPESLFNNIPLDGFDPKKEYELVYESDGSFTYLASIREVA